MKALHFVTWGTSDVPNYTKYYIDQLAPWFDQVYVSTNEGRPVDTDWFNLRRYHLNFVPNKARDYEKHYYWMMRQGRDVITSYEEVCFANDCLICYGPLTKLMTWCLTRPEEILGLNSSNFPIPHLQGYFLVMRQAMLGRVWDHFEKTGVVSSLDEVKEYELKLSDIASSMYPMYAQKRRRGWDELFWTPFDDGVPLVKHQCIMPRKLISLQRWQRRIVRLGHPDTKSWAHLPLIADPSYTFRAAEEPSSV